MSAPDAGQRRQALAASPMIRKLRWQFVAACMGLIAAVLAIVFGCVWASAQNALEHSSHMALEQALSRRGGDLLPGFRQNGGDDQVLLPYFTVQVWGTTVYVTGGTYSGLEDTDALTAILTDCLSQEADEGSLPGYALRYLRQDDGLYTQIAFVDISLETAALRQMMASYLRIGLLSLLLLAGASFLLSLRVTRPVERAWRQQRQFVADASHELKTPLTVIMANAELLQSPDYDSESKCQFSDSILTMSRQMRDLVERLLDLARTDNGQGKLAFSPLDLSDLVEKALLPFEPVFFEKGLRLSSQIQRGITVSGSGQQLRQVLDILLDNARKYTAARGDVVLRLERIHKHHCRLTVSTAGEGLSDADLKNIFKRFYRVDKARSRDGSFGLGLPIAESIVQAHHGRIWAESQNGVNTFFVELPIKQ